MKAKVTLIKIKNKTIINRSFLALFSILLSFNFSCKNDIDVNAPYKEAIVIFGLLDISADTQFIKINKAFLTEDQTVKEVALLPDSVYFTDLNATLVEINSGNAIALFPINVAGKNAGMFITNPNIMYFTAQKLNPNSEYKIVATNTKTNVTAESATALVGLPGIFGPASYFDTSFSMSNNASGFSIGFTPGRNALAYDIVMDFEYEEFSKFDTATKNVKKLTWKMLNSLDITSSSRIVRNLVNDLFYDFLTSRIEVRKDWVRRAKTFKFSYTGGGAELLNYISISKPSIGIVQKQSDYTNIKNGYGLFSSRSTLSVGPLPASVNTHDILARNAKTAALGF